MRLFGSLKELVSAVFRKNTYEITVQPNTGTYTGTTTLSLPPKLSGSDTLVSETAVQAITGKTQVTVDNLDLNGNTINATSGNLTVATTAGYIELNPSAGSAVNVNTDTSFSVSAPTTELGSDVVAIHQDTGATTPQIEIYDSTDTYAAVVRPGALTANRLWTFPDLAGAEFVGTTAAQTLTNKTISGASNTISNINLATQVTGTLPANNGGTGVANNVAATLTRSGNHDLAITTTAPSTVTMPTTGTLATLAGAEALTNKTLGSTNTLTGATAASFTNTGTVTLPTSGTLATLAGAEALTNKTQVVVDNIDIDGNTIQSTTGIIQVIGTGNANLIAGTSSDASVLAATGNVNITAVNTGYIRTKSQYIDIINVAGGSQPQIRLGEDPDSGSDYVAIQSPASLGSTYTLTLPADDGDSGEVLSTDGSGNLSWVSAATNSLTHRGIYIGDSSNVAQPLDTLTHGDIEANYSTATVTISNASPAVVTWTSHGQKTGNTVSFTTTGTLPTGVAGGVRYYLTKIDNNSFKISSTVENLKNDVFVNTSSAGAGTHTALTGGLRLEYSGLRRIPGQFDGATVGVGFIGEFKEGRVDVGAGSALTTGTWADVHASTQVSLTPGVWRLSGTIAFVGSGGPTGVTYLIGGISSSSGSSFADFAENKNNGWTYGDITVNTDVASTYVPGFIAHVATTTTYYLKAQATFTGGTIRPGGYILAQRIA